MINENKIWLSSNFHLGEFVCKDGLGSFRLNSKFIKAVNVLNRARTMLDTGLKINSAYRTKVHNKRVGGAPKSFHLKSYAFDVTFVKKKLRTKSNLDFLAALLKYLGFNAAGRNPKKGYVHADMGPKRKIY